MIIGVVSMYIANVQCQEVTDTKVKYEAVSGTFISQKAFIDAFTQDPDDLPDNSVRETRICTYYVHTYYSMPRTDVQGKSGLKLTEQVADTCIMAPYVVLNAAKFPDAFKFCNLDEIPGDLASVYGGETPYNFYTNMYDTDYPGWACGLNEMWKGIDYINENHCNGMASTNRVYPYCGMSVDPNYPLTWNSYDDWPTGTYTPYVHGYITHETITTQVCGQATAAFGAAIGYVTYFEMFATFLIAGLFVGLG